MTDNTKDKVYDLIKQAKEGKQKAFTELYNKYSNTIYNTIFFIVKNKDVADDILSITFCKAFQKIDSFVNNISFELWLKTIAVNSSVDYIRHVKKEKENMFLDDEENTVQLSSTVDYSPEEIYTYNETKERIKKALDSINWKYKNIIELRTNKNLSYKQIGEELNLTEMQVKALLNKAREKLKSLLT